MTKLDTLYAQCPRLTPGNHRITSDATRRYNCVAWVERDMARWWEPGFYWPIASPTPLPDQDLNHYLELFTTLGYSRCADGQLEDDYLKIAVYAEGGRFHHVAKQLPSGAWSSKAGPLHDLRHEDESLLEGVGVWSNARAEVYMRRQYDGADDFALEETGLV